MIVDLVGQSTIPLVFGKNISDRCISIIGNQFFNEKQLKKITSLFVQIISIFYLLF